MSEGIFLLQIKENLMMMMMMMIREKHKLKVEGDSKESLLGLTFNNHYQCHNSSQVNFRLMAE